MLGKVRIAWFGKHFGEEPPLVGTPTQGAGTIFFTGCNLKCIFCQNFQISQQGVGKNYSVTELAGLMLKLQQDNAVNIDLVSPTLYSEHCRQAILLAKGQGLKLPIIWNSNGYESLITIQGLKGLVDIYLPDFKYADDSLAEKYSSIKNYTQTTKLAITEMFNQVGNLRLNKQDEAMSGLIVRHLILPGQIENSKKVLKLIKEINPGIHVSLMSQYSPLFKASNYPELNRAITDEEFTEVYSYLQELGLTNGWVQEPDDEVALIPDFTKANPF